jgi:D-serine deaminase-like pyridoxal phosphate-dependent protein
VEITRLLLGKSHSKVIVSTLAEAYGAKPLIDEGIIKEVRFSSPCVPSALTRVQLLYGLPIGPSVLPELDLISLTVCTLIIIDHPSHVSLLSNFVRCSQNKAKPWSVFIKIDLGAHRAGLPVDSPALTELLLLVEQEPLIELYGFYAYASHAHCTGSVADAEGILDKQISELLTVSSLVKDKEKPLVLSVGSSPTARVIKPLQEKLPANITLEVHAGMST